MNVVWNDGELNNPTAAGLDNDSQQTTATVSGDESGQKVETKDLTIEVRRHLDGKLLRVMKTIANAGRFEIHVDVPITE